MRVRKPIFAISTGILLFALNGCSSSHANLVSGSKLGADKYDPAVVVVPGKEGMYSAFLTKCRSIAVKRQMSAADEAQLRNITGVIEGGVGGATAGYTYGALFKAGDYDVSRGGSAATGAAIGILGSLASSFAEGTEKTASETKRVLLNCVRAGSQNGKNWQVLE